MSGNGGTFNKGSVNKKRALIVLYLLMISKKRSQKTAVPKNTVSCNFTVFLGTAGQSG